MAMPQHGTGARPRVDENDGKLIRRTHHCSRRGQIDALAAEAFARERPKFIVAEAADVAPPPSETRAGSHGGGDLPAGVASELMQRLFCVRRGVGVDNGDEIDAVQPEAGDIERVRSGWRHPKRQAHAWHPTE